MWGTSVAPTGGNGTKESPYLIWNAANLQWFAEQVNAGQTSIYGTLTNDIDLSTVCSETLGSWIPIGNDTNKFEGVFDGNGHTISNIYINASTGKQALFGYANGNECVIKNITINGSITNTANYAAGICGRLGYPDGRTIENCVNNCTINGYSYGSGIVGVTAKNTMVKNWTNNGTITCSLGYCAGIVGECHSTIYRCVNNGKISRTTTSRTCFDGICGYVYFESTDSDFAISECINTADIAGYLYKGTISNSYSITANISSKQGKDGNSTYYPSRPGAIVGVNNSQIIKNCHYLNSIKTESNSTNVTSLGVMGIGTYITNTQCTSDTKGVTDGHDAGTFASGEVAYLLGNDKFGQNIGTDAYPAFLASKGSNKVFKVTFNNNDNTVYCSRYVTTGNPVASVPALPEGTYCWIIGGSLDNLFIPSTIVTADMIVTAKVIKKMNTGYISSMIIEI